MQPSSSRPARAVGTFGVLHDRRGTGLSSRDVPPPNRDTRERPVGSTSGDDRSAPGARREEPPRPVRCAPTGTACAVWTFWRTVSGHHDFRWGVKATTRSARGASCDDWGYRTYGERGRHRRREGPRRTNRTPGSSACERHTADPTSRGALPDLARDSTCRASSPRSRFRPCSSAARRSGGTWAARVHCRVDARRHRRAGRGRLRPRSSWEADPVTTVREFLSGSSTVLRSWTRVFSTVLFTDIVASTERGRPRRRAWRDLVLRHHAIVREAARAIAGVENGTAGDGFFATFDGPARAVRCAEQIVDAVRALGTRDPGRCAHRRGRADRRQVWWACRLRSAPVWPPRQVAVRGARLPDREGPGRRIGSHVRGRRRARAEGRSGPLAPLPGDQLRAMAVCAGPVC